MTSLLELSKFIASFESSALGRWREVLPWELTAQSSSVVRILLAELAAASRDVDSVSFRAKAHALRSAAANVGARGLADLCRAGEGAGPAELGPAGLHLVERLRTEFLRVRQALDSRAGGASSAPGT